MKKILKITFFSCLFVCSFSVLGQTTEKEYLDAEKARVDNVQATEIEISNYITANISSYGLPQSVIDETTNNLADEGVTTQPEIDAALLEIKKSELRKLYFVSYPAKKVYYEATPMPVVLRLQCINGGFENAAAPTANYAFFSSPGRLINGCATPGDVWPRTAALNNLNARITVVSAVDPNYTQFDPSLNTPARGNIQIPTISPNGGTHSVKLNISAGGRDVTTMTRNVFIGPTDTTLDYEFSLLLQNSNHPLGQRPFFRVDLIVGGNVVNSRCIQAQPNCIFINSHAAGTGVDQDIFFSGWRCDQIDVSNFRNQNATLAFTIADCNGGAHFGTVYIDNICGFTCPNPAFGSLITNPLNNTCPDLINNTPYQVCGTFNPPLNSVFNNMAISISQNGGAYVPITGATLQLTGNNYCLSFSPNVFGTSPGGNTYQFQITANYTQTCNGLVTNPSNTTFAQVAFANCCYPILTLTSANNMTNLFPLATRHNERSNWITASNVIGIGNNVFQNGVVYHAANFVDLMPGFDAINGSQFAAYPQGCTQNYVYRQPNTNSDNGGIKEPQEINLVKVYKELIVHPNPSKNFIDLSVKNDTFNKIIIVGIDGKMIIDKTIESTSSYNLDISKYASGIYIVNVISVNGKQYSQKLIKN